jgi:hypothetical protein
MARFGPGKAMELAAEKARLEAARQHLPEKAAADLHAAYQLEASYAGYLGKVIEPAIRPLGFDWKIGIALITSFAAREVFVGTMATIYSIGSTDDELSVRQRMAKEINPRTGLPVYGVATAFSLLIFYVLAMQCMSTLAVVKRETNSWKWPLLQFIFMTGMAYLLSLGGVVAQANPVRHFAFSGQCAPFVKAISGYQAVPAQCGRPERRFFQETFCPGIDQFSTICTVMAPVRNKSPGHRLQGHRPVVGDHIGPVCGCNMETELKRNGQFQSL